MFDANYNHSRMAHKPKVNFWMSASWMSHKPAVKLLDVGEMDVTTPQYWCELEELDGLMGDGEC